MVEEVIICYSFDNISPTKRKQFDRRMFGTVERTHGGKYETEIMGVLTNKKYRRPVRSVIVISRTYLEEVLTVLKEFSARTEIYRIAPL